MDQGSSTTGTRPFTVGSIEVFQEGFNPTTGQYTLTLNGQPWNLAGGSATLNFMDPNGNMTSYAATITNGGLTASVTWTVPAPTPSLNTLGPWARSWKFIDATGITQVSQPLQFAVIASPMWGE